MGPAVRIPSAGTSRGSALHSGTRRRAHLHLELVRIPGRGKGTGMTRMRRRGGLVVGGALLGLTMGLGGCVQESAIGWSSRVQAESAGVCSGDPVGQALYASGHTTTDGRIVAYVGDDGRLSMAVVAE